MGKGSKLLVTGAALAKMAGVSAPAVSQVKKNWPEEVFVGKKIDLENPIVQKWLEGNRQRATSKGQETLKQVQSDAVIQAQKPKQQKVQTAPKREGEAEGEDLPDLDQTKAGILSTEDVESISEMTLNEIYQRFGTQEQFKDLMVARKTIAEIRLKDVQANEKRGEFIPRALVSKYLIPLIDNSYTKLIEDLPPTLAAKSMKLTKAGEPVEVITEKIRTDMSKQIKDLKDDSVRMIESA